MFCWTIGHLAGKTIGPLVHCCVKYSIMYVIDASNYLKPFQQAGVILFLEELKIFCAILQYVSDAKLEIGFCNLDVPLEVGESHLRLNHPEFSKMPGCIWIFCSEGWPYIPGHLYLDSFIEKLADKLAHCFGTSADNLSFNFLMVGT